MCRPQRRARGRAALELGWSGKGLRNRRVPAPPRPPSPAPGAPASSTPAAKRWRGVSGELTRSMALTRWAADPPKAGGQADCTVGVWQLLAQGAGSFLRRGLAASGSGRHLKWRPCKVQDVGPASPAQQAWAVSGGWGRRSGQKRAQTQAPGVLGPGKILMLRPFKQPPCRRDCSASPVPCRLRGALAVHDVRRGARAGGTGGVWPGVAGAGQGRQGGHLRRQQPRVHAHHPGMRACIRQPADACANLGLHERICSCTRRGPTRRDMTACAALVGACRRFCGACFVGCCAPSALFHEPRVRAHPPGRAVGGWCC